MPRNEAETETGYWQLTIQW